LWHFLVVSLCSTPSGRGEISFSTIFKYCFVQDAACCSLDGLVNALAGWYELDCSDVSFNMSAATVVELEAVKVVWWMHVWGTEMLIQWVGILVIVRILFQQV
jgi:hypothetical protein